MDVLLGPLNARGNMEELVGWASDRPAERSWSRAIAPILLKNMIKEVEEAELYGCNLQ